jgi:uncharacterized protein YfkK (UPF0435 family)
MYSDGKEHLKDLKDRYIEALKVYNDKLSIYVIRDLKMKNYDGENFSFLYTYQEISKKYGISKSKVQSIAKKFNLSRRNRDTKPNGTEHRCWPEYR